jgi:isopentenyl-diphosphate delta-isomerase
LEIGLSGQFEERKRDHIRYSLDSATQTFGWSGLERIRLRHEALPELNFDELNLSSACVGKTLPTPFYISGMTAGHGDAPRLNRMLARASEARGWAMGVGSQRRDLENPDSIDGWSRFRAEFPRLQLFGNLGIAQVITSPVAEIQKLVDAIQATGIAVHLNAMQEAIQPEGTPQFSGGLRALERLCKSLSVPVVLKETGCGFSKKTLTRLAQTGLAAIDLSGLGGTHWGRIEGMRAPRGSLQARAAVTFAHWGESTVDSVRSAREILPELELWASGGVRSGLDAAKLIALGAHRVGYAQPALQAAMESEAALIAWMEQMEFELKVALFCTGCRTPSDLREGKDQWTWNVDKS